MKRLSTRKEIAELCKNTMNGFPLKDAHKKYKTLLNRPTNEKNKEYLSVGFRFGYWCGLREIERRLTTKIDCGEINYEHKAMGQIIK